MANNRKGDGTLMQGAVIAVTPENMGKGLKWNKNVGFGQYEVNAGNGLEVKNDGTVGLKNIADSTVPQNYIDATSGKVVGKVSKVDRGNGIMDVYLQLNMPLPKPNEGTLSSNQSAYDKDVDGFHQVIINAFVPGAQQYNKGRDGEYYRGEVWRTVQASEFGLKNFLMIQGISGDLSGSRTEGAWVLNWEMGGTSASLGVKSVVKASDNTLKGFFVLTGGKA